ncbi:phosphatidate cytidylyltransferase [Psychrobacter sp. F1192]|uniref:Phosphatidate cytidylyltransferase n=1 Tax=Psychrobacter coccoides TaxID=2818440 RepID=A0ABS3NP27_9GAMM|nr:phosphatidate cytidylyltransferase [Psychrobacter coccoides]MBO1531167.1 phosphatidate cytidylyltransferase [Psychrobacter coccoides]
MVATDTLFLIVLMTVVSVVWGVLALPYWRARLPTIYLIARSWWWMLALLCGCYLIAKTTGSNSPIDKQYPYQWLLVAFFILIGLRGSYEISRLWRSESKARLISKLKARGLQAHTLALPIPQKQTQTLDEPELDRQRGVQPFFYLNFLDVLFASVFILLIISLIFLQQLTWQREQYGVLLFVLFASQFNDIAQYLCGKLLKGKLFKRGLAPKISPNKSIEGAVFGSLLSALLATVLGVWLTPFSWWLCLLAAYMLAVSGIAGDLIESAFKRQHGVKDTGTLLAGHGGVLDRVDSLLIGVPIFTLLYWLLV